MIKIAQKNDAKSILRCGYVNGRKIKIVYNYENKSLQKDIKTLKLLKIQIIQY